MPEQVSVISKEWGLSKNERKKGINTSYFLPIPKDICQVTNPL
jgi:hypothetical protein